MPRSRLVASCATPILLAACVTAGPDGAGGVTRAIGAVPPPRAAEAVRGQTAQETAEYRTNGISPQINASAAYARGHTGAGVTVGIVDGLIDGSNPELAGRVQSIRRYTRTDAPDLRHGMAVAGVVAAARDGRGMQGVAPAAGLRNYAILNADGSIPGDGRVGRALNQALRDGVPIVNNSWGSLSGSPTLAEVRAMRGLVGAGSVLVWSAGNDGLPTPTREARLPLSRSGLARGWLVVASVDADNTLSSFSNACGAARNWCLVAPGNGVTTLGSAPRTVVRARGTSFAAPAASGALAVLMDAFPSLTAQQARTILLRTATPLGDPALYGRGLIDLERATRPLGRTSLGAFDAGRSALSAGAASGDGPARALGAAPMAVQDDFGRTYLTTLPAAAPAYIADEGLEGFDQPSGQQAALGGGGLFIDTQVDILASDTASLAAMSRQGARARADVARHPFLGLAEEGAGLSAGTRRIGVALAGDSEAGVFGGAVVVRPFAGHDLRLALGTISEDGAALGTTGTGALAIDGTTTTTFASLALRQPLTGPWSLAAGVHAGVSAMDGKGGSLVRGFEALSTAAAVSLDRADTFAPGGVLSLTVAQPLRVDSGGFDLDRPVARADGTIAPQAGRLDAVPSGRETDLELSWSGPAWQDGTGRLAASALHRLNPDHVADAPAETVVMGRFTLRF